MERNFTYPTSDFERDFDGCYLDETFDAVCELFRYSFDGKTLSQIEGEENEFESIESLENIIGVVSKNFASTHIKKIADNKKVVRFLRKFAAGFYKTDKMELTEMYEHWIEFVLLRFAYRRGIPVSMSPYEIVEKKLHTRLCLDDPLFPMIASAVYGKLRSRGLAPELNYSELEVMVNSILSRYKMSEGFFMALDFESWASMVYKSHSCGLSSGIIDAVLSLAMTVQKEFRKNGKDAEYDEIVDVVDYVWKHTEDLSEENVLDYIAQYNNLAAANNLFI